LGSTARTAGYLAVWEDRRNDSLGDIYGQLISASGALSGSNFVVSAYSGRSQSLPGVTCN